MAWHMSVEEDSDVEVPQDLQTKHFAEMVSSRLTEGVGKQIKEGSLHRPLLHIPSVENTHYSPHIPYSRDNR